MHGNHAPWDILPSQCYLCALHEPGPGQPLTDAATVPCSNYEATTAGHRLWLCMTETSDDLNLFEIDLDSLREGRDTRWYSSTDVRSRVNTR